MDTRLQHGDGPTHSHLLYNCNHYLWIHTTTHTTAHTPFACCWPLFETGWVCNHCEHSPHTTHHTRIVPHCVTSKMVSLEVDTHWQGLLPLGVWARYMLCHRRGLTFKHMHQLVVLTLHKHITPHRTPKTAKRHGRFHPSIMEGKDTPYSSPSQMGELLSAATAPPLTTWAELETPTASTLSSLPVKAHLATFLAGGRCCRAPSGDRLLRQDSPRDKQGQESKQWAQTK